MSIKAQTAAVLLDLKRASLISLGQICDDDCTIVLNKQKLITLKSDKISISVDSSNIIMTGRRNKNDGMYDIPISAPKEQMDNYFLQTNNVQTPKLHRLIEKKSTPKNIFPEVSLDDFLRQTATDMITLLTAPLFTTTVSLQAGDPTRNTLLEIATIFCSKDKFVSENRCNLFFILINLLTVLSDLYQVQFWQNTVEPPILCASVALSLCPSFLYLHSLLPRLQAP